MHQNQIVCRTASNRERILIHVYFTAAVIAQQNKPGGTAGKEFHCFIRPIRFRFARLTSPPPLGIHNQTYHETNHQDEGNQILHPFTSLSVRAFRLLYSYLSLGR